RAGLPMRVPLVTWLSTVCVTVAALTASANAAADRRYYGILQSSLMNGDADDGAFVNIDTSILHSTCNTIIDDFVDHEMWYFTDSSGNYWIEVGWRDGAITSLPLIQCTVDQAFWADSRPNGGG